MVATKTLLAAALVAVAAWSSPAEVDAHGYLMVPPAKLASSGDPTKYAATIYGPSALTPPAGMKFSDTIQNNLAAFTKAFKSAGWSSLASFLKKYAASAGACGTTSLTPSSPKTVGDYVQWSSFAESHVGPCEVWCDNTRVFHNDNCAGAYKTAPAKLAINKAKCAKAKQLTFYWLALHEINWQVYINCVSLKGSETRSIDDDDDESEEEDKETAAAVDADDSADDEEQATSSEVRATSNDEDCDEDLPEPDCEEDLPEPGADADADADCDEDLPEPDCDDDLPEPSDAAAGDADTPSTPVTTKPATKTPSAPAAPTPVKPSTPSAGGGEVGGDADCDGDLPEPDCDDDLPEPDCDDDLPEPSETSSGAANATEVGGEGDSYGFDALQRGAKYTPGKAEADDY